MYQFLGPMYQAPPSLLIHVSRDGRKWLHGTMVRKEDVE